MKHSKSLEFRVTSLRVRAEQLGLIIPTSKMDMAKVVIILIG